MAQKLEHPQNGSSGVGDRDAGKEGGGGGIQETAGAHGDHCLPGRIQRCDAQNLYASLLPGFFRVTLLGLRKFRGVAGSKLLE
jgi:hypothetical protein